MLGKLCIIYTFYMHDIKMTYETQLKDELLLSTEHRVMFSIIWGMPKSLFTVSTPWKINMEPENDGLEDDFPF